MACLQLIQIFKEIFEDVGLGDDLWLHPYRVIATGASSGIVEVICDTLSLDGLKKSPGFTTLANFFDKTYSTSPERLDVAKKSFVSSLAAYSLACYVLFIKDRHNGNILVDAEGHIIHIDFGFILSIAPGGAFSLESAPLKLTREMLDVMGGFESAYFRQFVRSFTSGFLALRDNSETIVSTLSLLANGSTFPCFLKKDREQVLAGLKARFRKELSVKDAIQFCLDLIMESYSNLGTGQYDSFQWLSNGIMA